MQLDPVQEEIQGAVRKAHILRGRGDMTGAEAAIGEVLAKYPDHPEAAEARAEVLAESGKLIEARDLLADVIKNHPGRINTERKHAALVLRVAEKEMLHQMALAGADISAYMNPAGIKRHAGTAAFFNLLLPGFGQIYNGELTKGLFLSGFTVLAWIGMFALALERVPDGVRKDGSPKFATHTTGFFWPIVVSLLTAYIVSIFDAASTAKHAQVVAAPVRPAPPVDKPFE